MMRIELFGTIKELQEYQAVEKGTLQENINKYERDALLIENHLSFFFEKKYLENLRTILEEDLKLDLYFSLLYTSEFLKHEKDRYDVIQLSEEYYGENFEDITSSTKNQWVNRFRNYTKKRFISDLMQYDEETKTIPYFLFELTKYYIFYSNTCGITNKNMKMEVYREFVKDFLKEYSSWEHSKEKILLFYKFEKIFKPRIIYSYRSLLESQYRKKYYNDIQWENVLGKYNYQLPCDICDFMSVILADALSYDQDQYHEDEERQIDDFKDTVHKLIEKFGELAEFWPDYKREIFFRLYEKDGLDGVSQESMKALLNVTSADYIYNTIEDLERSVNYKTKTLYETMYGIKCSSLLQSRGNNEFNRKERMQISKRIEKDALRLFISDEKK